MFVREYCRLNEKFQSTASGARASSGFQEALSRRRRGTGGKVIIHSPFFGAPNLVKPPLAIALH